MDWAFLRFFKTSKYIKNYCKIRQYLKDNGTVSVPFWHQWKRGGQDNRTVPIVPINLPKQAQIGNPLYRVFRLLLQILHLQMVFLFYLL